MTAMEMQIRRLVTKGLENLMEKSRLLWPGKNEQLLERNLSFYVGVELVNAGFVVVEEFPVNPEERIDLVAFHGDTKTLVLLESKRLWRLHGAKDAARCVDDMVRAEGFVKKGLEVWSFETETVTSLQPMECFGIALASASGPNATQAAANLLDVRKCFGKLAGEFAEMPHGDKTYFALHRVWKIL